MIKTLSAIVFCYFLLMLCSSVRAVPSAEVTFKCLFDRNLKNEVNQSSNNTTDPDKNIVFVPGKTDQAVWVKNRKGLHFPTKGNISSAQGTIAMWVSKRGGSDKLRSMNIFSTSTGHKRGKLFNAIVLYIVKPRKLDTFYIRTLLSNGNSTTSERSICTAPFTMKNGVWHYIVMSWNRSEVLLSIDGKIFERRGKKKNYRFMCRINLPGLLR